MGEQAVSLLLHPELKSSAAFKAFVSEQLKWTEFLSFVELCDKFLAFCVSHVLGRGIELIDFTTACFQKVASLAMAKRVKLLAPGVFIVIGGAAADPPMGDAISDEYDFVDFVVQGDAEDTFPALLARLFDNPIGPSSRVSGRLIKPKQTAISTELPDYSDYLIALELQTLPLGSGAPSYEGSRGCWSVKRTIAFCGLKWFSNEL